jgi:hypothetical protein
MSRPRLAAFLPVNISLKRSRTAGVISQNRFSTQQWKILWKSRKVYRQIVFFQEVLHLALAWVLARKW